MVRVELPANDEPELRQALYLSLTIPPAKPSRLESGFGLVMVVMMMIMQSLIRTIVYDLMDDAHFDE